MIYFIRSESGHVKIGYSRNRNIQKRLVSLQTSCPLELTILKVINGNRDKEKAFHAQFAKYKSSGEWFILSDEISKFIETINDTIFISKKKPTNKKEHPLERYRKIHNMTQGQLAKKLKTSISTVSRVESEKQKVNGETATQWEEALEKEIRKEELVWP